MGGEGTTDIAGASTLLECPGTRSIYTPAMESKYGPWLEVFETSL